MIINLFSMDGLILEYMYEKRNVSCLERYWDN